MDSVKLLDRMDSKYAFQLALLPPLLEGLLAHYRILDIEGVRASQYETLYFDTADLELYHKHHSGFLNRYKVRFRRYVESNLNFFEVKFKSNKGRTIKTRQKEKKISNQIENQSQSLLESLSPLKAIDLKETIWVYYKRITLVNKHSAERLTIDLDLTYKIGSKEKKFPNLVIAEVKQDKASRSTVTFLMRKLKIQKVSMSKYCFGVAHLHQNVKKNHFKHKMYQINKICNSNE